MADPVWKQSVQMDLRPAYYDAFRCLAQDCRLSCCKGWNVTFDKKDYEKLRQHARIPVLAESLNAGLSKLEKESLKKQTRHYAELKMQNGACPLLAENGLCRLQLHSGEQALPFVCRTFPRVERYSRMGYLERSLTLGCEGVLYQLWNLPDGVEFCSDPLTPQRCGTISGDTPPSILPEQCHHIRSLCIDLLQDRRLPLSQRVLLVGLRLQALIQGQEEPAEWLAATEGLLNLPETVEIAKPLMVSDERAKTMCLINNVVLLERLKANSPAFKVLHSVLFETLNFEVKSDFKNETIFMGPYQKAQEKFESLYRDEEYFFENLAVALFFHLNMPTGSTKEEWWKSYVNYCNILSFYRFLAVLSTTAVLPPLNGEALDPGSKEALIYLLTQASRALLHNSRRTNQLRDEFFKNDSATLAHMAILLCG